MALDLFDIAAANTAAVELRFEEMKNSKTGDEAVTLVQFRDHVQNQSTISVNTRPCVVLDILTTGRYQNIHEWAVEPATVSGRNTEEILREKLKNLYEKRLAFDGAFTGGDQFRYGALYLSGAGTTRYGEFCVVIREDCIASGIPVAYLLGDSLESYVRTDCTVDESGIREHTTPHSHRGYLAAIKLCDPLYGKPESDWPLLLCSDDDYIEAIFQADLNHTLVERICIPVAEYSRLWDLAFSDYAKELGPAARALAHDFASLLSAAQKRSILLEEV